MGHTLNIKNFGDLKYYLGIQFQSYKISKISTLDEKIAEELDQ